MKKMIYLLLLIFTCIGCKPALAMRPPIDDIIIPEDSLRQIAEVLAFFKQKFEHALAETKSKKVFAEREVAATQRIYNRIAPRRDPNDRMVRMLQERIGNETAEIKRYGDTAIRTEQMLDILEKIIAVMQQMQASGTRKIFAQDISGIVADLQTVRSSLGETVGTASNLMPTDIREFENKMSTIINLLIPAKRTAPPQPQRAEAEAAEAEAAAAEQHAAEEQREAQEAERHAAEERSEAQAARQRALEARLKAGQH